MASRGHPPTGPSLAASVATRSTHGLTGICPRGPAWHLPVGPWGPAWAPPAPQRSGLSRRGAALALAQAEEGRQGLHWQRPRHEVLHVQHGRHHGSQAEARAQAQQQPRAACVPARAPRLRPGGHAVAIAVAGGDEAADQDHAVGHGRNKAAGGLGPGVAADLALVAGLPPRGWVRQAGGGALQRVPDLQEGAHERGLRERDARAREPRLQEPQGLGQALARGAEGQKAGHAAEAREQALADEEEHHRPQPAGLGPGA
mmetsp:Transcript_5984/g.18535  ORF Transcript_5984/g.18535 Transcript_5984/m.18535 type:complete len:258 (+) Transcript_5984:367-1140(+)